MSLRSLRALRSPLAARYSTAAPLAPPALELRLRDGLKAAMKARDRAAVAVHKAVLADITYAVKAGPDPNGVASYEGVVAALRKGIEKRADAALAYAPTSSTPHADNHAALLSEIAVLQSYLPDAPSAAALDALVGRVVGELSADERASRGVMGTVLKRVWEALGDARAGVDKKVVVAGIQEALRR
ncbi:hypothetical protein Q5752_005687 [Cryptotrichosporon argae]